MLDVDALANEIRRVDGNHWLGAGALAEALMPWLEGESMYHGSGERITRRDLNSAYQRGKSDGYELADPLSHLVTHCEDDSWPD